MLRSCLAKRHLSLHEFSLSPLLTCNSSRPFFRVHAHHQHFGRSFRSDVFFADDFSHSGNAGHIAKLHFHSFCREVRTKYQRIAFELARLHHAARKSIAEHVRLVGLLLGIPGDDQQPFKITPPRHANGTGSQSNFRLARVRWCKHPSRFRLADRTAFLRMFPYSPTSQDTVSSGGLSPAKPFAPRLAAPFRQHWPAAFPQARRNTTMLRNYNVRGACRSCFPPVFYVKAKLHVVRVRARPL